jgi:hypothetical protein
MELVLEAGWWAVVAVSVVVGAVFAGVVLMIAGAFVVAVVDELRPSPMPTWWWTALMLAAFVVVLAGSFVWLFAEALA